MEAQVKMAWAVKASQRYSDFLRDIRNSEKKPEYMSDDVWRQWKASWDKPEFKMKREKNSNNRRSIAGPSSHTGGSVSNVEHGKRLDKVLSLREAPQAISGSRNDNSQPIDEVALYYEAVGGEKKRRVYGLGSQASYYCGGNINASKSSASSFESQNQKELQNELATMKKKIEAQDNLIVDLKRTIEMCNHIGMPPLHRTQNASNNQSEECEGTRDRDGDGDGGEDPGVL